MGKKMQNWIEREIGYYERKIKRQKEYIEWLEELKTYDKDPLKMADIIQGWLIEAGQHDYEKFKLGDTIRYTPSEVESSSRFFNEIRKCLDRWEDIILKHGYDDLSDEEEDFLRNDAIYLAKALYNELPSITCVTKLLQVLIEENVGNY